jgi:predicted metal-dependent phosphoesterase TrpH
MADPATEPLLRVDLHCHSQASFDCLSRPEEILAAALRRGIDRLAITDHNAIDGARRLHALDPERIVIGEEVKTREGVDIIGLFLRELIPAGTPARETCERIHEQGGVVYMPHPFDRRRAGGGKLLDELAELIDVVEVHNARTSARLNRQAEAWSRRRGTLMGAGSDAHTPAEIGRGYLEAPCFEPNRESFLRALARAEVVGREISSPWCRVWSAYARLRKLLPGGAAWG